MLGEWLTFTTSFLNKKYNCDYETVIYLNSNIFAEKNPFILLWLAFF